MNRILSASVGLLFATAAFAQAPPLPIGPGGGAGGGGVPFGVTPYVFATKTLFQAATSIPAAVNYVTVNAVTGTYPPAAGQVATPLTYQRVGSATGLWGEVTVGSAIFDPVYSTSPINIGEWGLVSDGLFPQLGATLTASANGTNILSVTSTAGVTSSICGVNGINVANVNYATRAGLSLTNIPANTTCTGFVTNTSITLSNNVSTFTNQPIALYNIAMTGTDNYPAYQAALNFGLQYGYSDFTCPSGTYLINDTLSLGWGNAFVANRLTGGRQASFEGALPGCSLIFPRTDRPGINFQGQRFGGLYGMTVRGPNLNFVQQSQATNSALSSNPADWIAPELVPGGASGGLTQHTPLVGVAVDARAGASPSPAYPNQTFPAFVGTPGQYNQRVSSKIQIWDSEVDGFAINVAGGLNSNSQGDFISIRDDTSLYAAYALGIFETQSRNVEIRNLNVNGVNTILSTKALGMQEGELGGVVDNINGTTLYQMFDIGLSFSGPMVITSAYCENCVTLGNFLNSSSFSSGVVFTGGILNFSELAHGQIPDAYIHSGGKVQYQFREVTITGNGRISNLVVGGTPEVHLYGGNFDCAASSGTTASLLQAVNYSGGCLGGSARFNSNSVNQFWVDTNALMSYYHTVSGSIGAIVHNNTLSFSSSAGTLQRAPMTQAGRYYSDEQGRQWRLTVPPEEQVVFTNTAQVGTAPSYSNDTMTFGWCGAFQAIGGLEAVAAGDLVYVNNTGTIFVVTAVAGSSSSMPTCSGGVGWVVTTQQQNNITVTPGTNTFVSNVNSDTTLAGQSQLIKTGAVIPGQLYWGTFASNTSVATISLGDNATGGSSLSSFIAAGDPMFCPGFITTLVWVCGVHGNSIATVTNANPGSATLTGNATASGVFPVFPYELR